ncbi:DUF2442 domain-containing protein [Pontibacter toksunensis]|uniref:DUF2442 domain-containing protein n=1 Tax=Pontibacter toksunensis TaxID=1332631 RepID=A0ABW6C424_9BACT
MSILAKKSTPQAQKVWFIDAKMYVLLADGRELGVPLEWFSKLRDATEAQRMNWRLIGGGVGIHWEELDEDLSVAGLL